MVQLVVRKLESQSVEEWFILELQGDLESTTEQNLKNQFVGDLHYTKKGVPILIIGHHILYGKVVDLQKPFAVLKRERSINYPDIHQTKQPTETDSSTEYIVMAVIKKKLLFKTRPKPIISKKLQKTD